MNGVSQEFSAKTVDAAISEGLRALRVSRDQVEIEVLHEGSRGLLGIGSTNARVRITLLPPPVIDTEATDADSALARAEEEAAMHTPTEVEAVEDDKPIGAEDLATAAEYEHVGQEHAEPVSAEVLPTASPRASTEERAPGDGVAASVTERVATEDEPASEDEYGETYDEEEGQAYDYGDLNHEELSELATELLGDLVDHMGFDADVEASWGQGENAPLNLNVVGDNLGMLIGRHGETLASIQYLLRLMINQRIHRWTNIVVDVDGYKARRAEQLTQMAQRMADQVVRTARPVALEPMPANERRLVHMALRNHPHVYTESTGDADRRKVQILLK
jgi:spoIIIJ-associated protein